MGSYVGRKRICENSSGDQPWQRPTFFIRRNCQSIGCYAKQYFFFPPYFQLNNFNLEFMVCYRFLQLMALSEMSKIKAICCERQNNFSLVIYIQYIKKNLFNSSYGIFSSKIFSSIRILIMISRRDIAGQKHKQYPKKTYSM